MAEISLSNVSSGGGSTSPGGSNGQIQYNNGGSFGGANITYDDTNDFTGFGTATPAGKVHISGGSAIVREILDSADTAAKIYSFRSNGSPRWAFRVDGADTGSNAGSNWSLRRYNDAGTFVAAPISVNRATGETTISENLTLGGSALKNFVPAINSGGALTVSASNQDTYNASVYNVTGAVNIQIDADVRIGFSMTIYQTDNNKCTIVAGAGLTLRNRQTHTKSAGQYAVISIVRIGSDLVLTGDTSA